MRRTANTTAFATAIALRSSTTAWMRRLCFSHQWIEIGRHDDRVSERCARCDNVRYWHLPIVGHGP
jgi:hypothetical protein